MECEGLVDRLVDLKHGQTIFLQDMEFSADNRYMRIIRVRLFSL
jgi:L-fucose mutarotase/ribose pyranase (RbsD/FucU family)